MKTILHLDKICNLKTNATLEMYLQHKSVQFEGNDTRPCVIICPGGSYQYTSDREAEPVALKFASEGFNIFVLRYSVLPLQYPLQILELAGAISYVRKNSDKLYIDKDNITICGFSAGGHVCASLATLWNRDFIKDALQIKPADCYPNKMILAYPLIDITSFLPDEFIITDVNTVPSGKEYFNTSLDKYVTKDTPPTFLWHTLNDNTVPVGDSFLFAHALKQHNIPFELHIYQSGRHGLSLGTPQSASHTDHVNPHVSSWFNLALGWLK